MGQTIINCFPTEQEEPEEQDEKTETQETEEKPQETPSTAAGTSQASEGAQPLPLTKLDRNKVDSVWVEVRGNTAERPSEDFIKKAIKKDDFDGSGVLEKTECKRLCESFQLRAKKNGDIFDSWEHVFQFLDRNNDETLDFGDIKYTMTVMWLMTKDRVSLQRLTACDEEKPSTSAPPAEGSQGTGSKV